MSRQRLLDEAGRPVLAHFNDVLPRRPIRFVVRSPRLRCKPMVIFFGDPKYESGPLLADSITAPWAKDLSCIPILKALRTPSTSWWVSARGTLERVASEYEVRVPDLLPREGWRLVGAAEAAAMVDARRRDPNAPHMGELDEELELQHANARRRKARVAVEAARASLAVWQRKAKLAATKVKKYERLVALRVTAERKLRGGES